jgi:signal transduction histidine kinase
MTVTPVRDPQGEITHFIAIKQDITEQKKAAEALESAYAQLQSAQKDLIQSEKFAALGRFSLGIAHEVKNPLGVILAGIEFLEKKVQDSGEDIRSAFDLMREATLRADTVVRDMLQFSRPSVGQKDIAEVDKLINKDLGLISYQLKRKKIILNTDFVPGLKIKADLNQIQQAFFNLITNAVDEMEDGGQLTVRTYREDQEAAGQAEAWCVTCQNYLSRSLPPSGIQKAPAWGFLSQNLSLRNTRAISASTLNWGRAPRLRSGFRWRCRHRPDLAAHTALEKSPVRS